MGRSGAWRRGDPWWDYRFSWGVDIERIVFSPDGKVMSDAEWRENKHRFLPTDEDRAYVTSLMSAAVIEPGKFADLTVLDPAATAVLQSRHALSQSLEDILFSLVILGDDRAVSATYVAGRRLHARDNSA